MVVYKSCVNKVSLVREKTQIKKVKIRDSKHVNEFLRDIWDNDIDVIETCYLLFLNQSNNITGYTVLSKGGITASYVDTRVVCKYAIDTLATSVIFAHNHPSGSLLFSEADINISKKLQKCLKEFDIKLLDSVIITSEGYKSLLDEGKL